MSGNDRHLAARLDSIRLDQARRWQHAERILVEKYLLAEPELAQDDEAVLDLIYCEVLLREKAGERPEVDEYVTRFPNFAETIRRQFTVHAELKSLYCLDSEPTLSARQESSWSDADVELEPVCDAFEHAWSDGAQPRIEVFLDRVDPSRRLDLLRELILIDCEWRRKAGDMPKREEYAARFAELGSEWDRLFPHGEARPRDERHDSPLVTSSNAGPSACRDVDWPLTLPVLPDYELLGELGRGGMGVVYKARHVQLKRIVALKMIRDRAMADGTTLARFRVEAEAVARLQHPHIVQIYDFGEHNGSPYLSLEYIGGGSLEAWTRPPLHSVRESAAMIEIVALAVGYAHEQQIIHRDLKPANILLAPGDVPSESHDKTGHGDEPSHRDALGFQPKITDFGLAKQFTNESNLTESEAILGTGSYMSPEQAWGHSRDVGPATDVHALGVILYELLTGQTPFRDESLMKTLDRVRFEAAGPPSRLRPEIPAALDDICMRCLCKRPEERYSTAEALADDLRRFLIGEPLANVGRAKRWRQWRRSPALVGTVVLSVVGICLGFLHWSGTGQEPAPYSGPPLITPSPPAARTQAEPFAFLVGVRSYRFGEDRVDLEYTESDVDELSRVLLRQGYPRSNIRLLTQWSEADNPDLAPTATNIRRQLRRMLDSCIPDDTFLVAITGMGGESGTPGMYCYLPSDSQPDQPESLMSLAEFYDLFRDCKARWKLLLVDTCQTVAIEDLVWPKSPSPPQGVAALFACSPHEVSYEHARLRHGVFSYHVLRGLEGDADVDKDGRIALDELLKFTRSGVQDFLRDNVPGGVQTPTLISSLDGATPLIERRTDAMPRISP